MKILKRWGRPAASNLRRDIDEVLEEFFPPRALRREVERLLGEDLAPRSLWQELDRVLEQFVSPMPLRRRIGQLFESHSSRSSHSLEGAERERGMFVPEVELVERDEEYLLSVDLPGVRQDDVDVSVDEGNLLTIRGERQEEDVRQIRGYEYSERSYGAFSRFVELPRGVDASKIEATYADGVLRLHIPKMEQAAGRRIPVEPRVMMGSVSSANAERRDVRARTQANSR